MAQSYDYIIVGAGVLGLSVANYLSKKGNFKILVLEKHGSIAQGNTSKSAAGFRDLFTSELNIKVSKSSIAYYEYVHNNLKNLGLEKIGYLILEDEEAVKRHDKIIPKLKSHTGVDLVDESDLKEIGLNTNPSDDEAKMMELPHVVRGIFGRNCGIMDPELIAQHYYEEAVKQGVEFKFNVEVNKLIIKGYPELGIEGEPFTWQDVKVTGVKANDLEVEGNVILANDVWVNRLARPAGVESFVSPKKRQIFQLKGDQISKFFRKNKFNNYSGIPFTFLPMVEFYVRPSFTENSIWVGGSDELNRPIEVEDDPLPEREYFEYNLAPILRQYFGVNNFELSGMWAGQYSMNYIDLQPIIFGDNGIYIVSGSSGSGIMKADAIGRIASSFITGEKITELYGGEYIRSDALTIENRDHEKEEFIF